MRRIPKLSKAELRLRHLERQRRHYQENKDKKKAYAAANREKIKARKAARYMENAAEISRKGSAYYLANKDTIKAKRSTTEYKTAQAAATRNRRKKNGDRIRAVERARRAANPEKYRKKKHPMTAEQVEARRLYDQKYESENRDRLLLRRIKYRARRAPEIKKWNDSYRKTPAGKMASTNATHRRRARKMAIEHSATAAQALEFMQSKSHCFYCDRSGLKLTLDHFIPIKRLGPHSLENFRAACRPCNSRKKDRDPHEFIAWLVKNPYPDQVQEKISENKA